MIKAGPLHTFTTGAVAGGASLAVGELAAVVLPSARSPLTGLGRTLIDLTPGPAVDMTVATAEELDKPLLAATLVAQWLAAGVFAARVRRGGGLVLAAHGAVAGAAAASRPEASPLSSLAAGLLGASAGVQVLRRFGREAEASRLLATTAVVGAAGGLARLVRDRRTRGLEARRRAVSLPAAQRPAGPPPPSAQLDVPGLTPLFTPPSEFYVTDVSFPAPRVDPADWRLRVHGLVERELTLTLPDLLAMELTELDATLACVHNPVGGPRIGTGRWVGVRLVDLLERAGVRPGAEQLVARSVDGFSAGVPVDAILDGRDALVAVGLGGEPLPAANGFPARLLVPGLWGADANTKWLGSLELTTWAAVSDYWDSRGWPRRPTPVKPGSRIDVPVHRAHLQAGPVTIAGVAWAPPEGVRGVEVSVDDAPWQAVEVGGELAPTAWRQWRHEWLAPEGEHRLRVRTVGRAGVQAKEPAPPYPEGSGGYHEVRVRVHEALASTTPRVRRMRRLGDGLADVRRRAVLASMAPPAWFRHRGSIS